MPLALDDALLPARSGRTTRPGTLSAEVPIRRFTRLAEVAGNPDDTLAVDASIRYADDGSPLLAARVHGCVELVCQRCLGRLRHEVDLAIRLAIVPEDGEPLAPAGYEAWETPGDQQRPPRLRTLIEDEVMLALPLIARHDRRSDCESLSRHLVDAPEEGDAGAAAVPSQRDNPFAVLQTLKGRD